MSTFARTTTPPFSANPFQAFVTYKQARRAARGASLLALVIAGLIAISMIPLLASAEFAYLSPAKKRAVFAITGTMIVGFLCLGWRIWVRPGPWKIVPILAFLLLDATAELFRFVVLNLVIVGVILNFTIIAYRGSLAMKRLQAKTDLDVF